jgi:HJR/Mrr/RecB family endonuclease
MNFFKVGHQYKDILSVSKEDDQFVSWFSIEGSGIGNSGGIRAAKHAFLKSEFPSYIVLITRETTHRVVNPWEDIVDYGTATILYWGDAKFDDTKSYPDFKGNKRLLQVWESVLSGNLLDVPPILHFSKPKSGQVKFNGLCVLKDLSISWFQQEEKPIKNYRAELVILDCEEVHVNWLHDIAKSSNQGELPKSTPKVWKDYIKGNTRKLDIFKKDIKHKEEQLPPEGSVEAGLLQNLHDLTPTEFEAVVVELFKNLPHVNHKITRTRPTSDGGFDFYGQFSIPYPIHYEIGFLGEVKKYARTTSVTPKDVSRLVARLSRGQFGLFVTTSYFTKQTQQEVLEDGYPVKLFSGIDLVNFLKELRLVDKDKIRVEWLESVTKSLEL